jgi:anion-transporting  ArsA/GET3 family ATPase
VPQARRENQMSVTIEDIERAIRKLRKQRREILKTRELLTHPGQIEVSQMQTEGNQLSIQMRLRMLRRLREQRKHKKKAPRGG